MDINILFYSFSLLVFTPEFASVAHSSYFTNDNIFKLYHIIQSVQVIDWLSTRLRQVTNGFNDTNLRININKMNINAPPSPFIKIYAIKVESLLIKNNP